MAAPAVPVLMYHSVAQDFAHTPINWLVYPQDLFERSMALLAREGWTTPTMDQLADHLEGKRALPAKSAVLTFDDGYLDNWVIVAPILKKYGLHGVVWVTKEFIEEGERVRPTLDDVAAGHVSPDDLQIWGYLNRAELRALHQNGVLEIQSHNSTHTWVFTGPEVEDFHHPGSPHFWMPWNHAPRQKTRWLTENQDHLVPWGTPIYRNARAMGRQYHPDPELAQHLQRHVAVAGGTAFFDRPGWREELRALVDGFRREHGERGHLESDSQWAARIRAELTEVRDFCATECDVPLTHHCWPGGDYNDEVERIALDVGYRTTTIRSGRNVFAKSQPHRVDRIAMPYRAWPGPLRGLNVLYFKAKLDSYRGAQPIHGLHQLLRRTRRIVGRI